MGPMKRYRTREHPGLASAWAAFARDMREELPREAALGVAAPIEGDELKFMNSDWRIDRWNLAAELGLDRVTLINDFGAVAHAVSVLRPDELEPISGAGDLPLEGVVSVIGPGTGLGVSILVRGPRPGQAAVCVIETEAAHIGFSPLDPEEEELADALAGRYGRTSLERVVSGPGLIDIYRFLGGGDWDPLDAGTLWSHAVDETDALASRALDILVRCFGAAAGDISLAHGAMGVVLTGGLANRMAGRLRSPTFEARFTAKGRYRERMMRVPVKLAIYPEPGLLGAAVAFLKEFG